MWILRAILGLFLIIVVIAFAYNNFGPEQTVDVNLEPIYYNYADVPLVTVVFWSLVGGVLIAFTLFVSVYIRQAVQIRAAHRKIKSLESELSVLRNRPIEESADLLAGSDSEAAGAESLFDRES